MALSSSVQLVFAARLLFTFFRSLSALEHMVAIDTIESKPVRLFMRYAMPLARTRDDSESDGSQRIATSAGHSLACWHRTKHQKQQQSLSSSESNWGLYLLP